MAMSTVAVSSKRDNLITLKSSTGARFTLSSTAAKCSRTIQAILRDVGDAEKLNAITLSSVPSDIVERVVDWMEFHRDDDADYYVVRTQHQHHFHRFQQDQRKYVTRIVFSEWDKRFFEDVSEHVRCELLKAAQQLDIPEMVQMCMKVMQDMLDGKTWFDVIQMFPFPNDLPPGVV